MLNNYVNQAETVSFQNSFKFVSHPTIRRYIFSILKASLSNVRKRKQKSRHNLSSSPASVSEFDPFDLYWIGWSFQCCVGLPTDLVSLSV
jgi:hypothetical protein